MNDSIESQLKASTLFESRIVNEQRNHITETRSKREQDRQENEQKNNPQKRRQKKSP